VYQMNVLRLAPYFLDERRRFRKCRLSTLLFIYSCVMLLIFLFISLALIFGNMFNYKMDNVYTLAAMMQSSACVISHSCFLFSTHLFLGEVVKFLHVLLSFNSSIYFIFTAFDSNFNHVKAQMSELVPLHTLTAFLIFFFFSNLK
jgi:hypothetical protein